MKALKFTRGIISRLQRVEPLAARLVPRSPGPHYRARSPAMCPPLVARSRLAGPHWHSPAPNQPFVRPSDHSSKGSQGSASGLAALEAVAFLWLSQSGWICEGAKASQSLPPPYRCRQTLCWLRSEALSPSIALAIDRPRRRCGRLETLRRAASRWEPLSPLQEH